MATASLRQAKNSRRKTSSLVSVYEPKNTNVIIEEFPSEIANDRFPTNKASREADSGRDEKAAEENASSK